MAGRQLGAALRHLHGLAAARDGERYTDGELLDQLDGPGAEGAFAALVRRHGPLVLGACRRVLRDAHEAEDAFQAAFLVLFRRARRLDRRRPLAGWLYTVAVRAAQKARAAGLRRRRRERLALTAPRASPAAEAGVENLRPVLDEELSRLPERLRGPVVLCYLEGKTTAEAGRLLGCPAGTVKSRLARARALLRAALLRRGVAPALAGLVTHEARAAVPAPLLHAAVRCAFRPVGGAAAVTLAKGVLQAMCRTRLKMAAAALLAFAAMAVGAGTFLSPAWPPGPATARASGPKADPAPASAPVALSPAEDESTRYVRLFGRVRGLLGEFFEVGYANMYDGRIETRPRVLPALGRFPALVQAVRYRAEVSIRAADEGGYVVNVIVLAERRTGGWAALLGELYGKGGAARWAPAGRNAGLEAALLRRLKQAGLGDEVKLAPATAAPIPTSNGTSTARD
jgi:RNA polymerase sigma-70 factor (ECF subfamily)